jgi:RNA polymerase sigma-70 factor (ECF subfamily)
MVSVQVLAPARCRTVAVVRGPEQGGRERSDEVLLARVRAGDQRALERIYDELGGMVHGLARRVTGDEQVAREVTQDVFVHLWQKPDAVDLNRGSLRAYVGVVAHRRAVDAVRRATSRRRAETAVGDQPMVTDSFEDAVAEVDARAWSSEQLAAALEQLPTEQRDAVVLAYFGGLRYTEVAVRLDIPEGTAKSRIRLGLARVRTLVGDDLMVDR